MRTLLPLSRLISTSPGMMGGPLKTGAGVLPLSIAGTGVGCASTFLSLTCAEAPAASSRDTTAKPITVRNIGGLPSGEAGTELDLRHVPCIVEGQGVQCKGKARNVAKAEGEGFEPSDDLRRLRFSRPVQSAALPPLRRCGLLHCKDAAPG